MQDEPRERLSTDDLTGAAPRVLREGAVARAELADLL